MLSKGKKKKFGALHYPMIHKAEILGAIGEVDKTKSGPMSVTSDKGT